MRFFSRIIILPCVLTVNNPAITFYSFVLFCVLFLVFGEICAGGTRVICITFKQAFFNVVVIDALFKLFSALII